MGWTDGKSNKIWLYYLKPFREFQEPIYIYNSRTVFLGFSHRLCHANGRIWNKMDWTDTKIRKKIYGHGVTGLDIWQTIKINFVGKPFRKIWEPLISKAPGFYFQTQSLWDICVFTIVDVVALTAAVTSSLLKWVDHKPIGKIWGWVTQLFEQGEEMVRFLERLSFLWIYSSHS